MTRRPVPDLTTVDLLASLPLGVDPNARPLPEPSGAGVLAELERAVLPALGREPCVVTFSGGRDSSAILAVATAVARRHGLADPVPVILRYPDAPETDETEWQELVLNHLQIKRVEILEMRHELDLLGPVGTAVLRRNGVRWPSNAFVHVPLIGAARGGSLLTGVGGDEIFGTRGARRSLLPRVARAVRWQRTAAPPFPWLTEAGLRLVHRALASEEVSWPHTWDGAMRYWYSSRAFSAVDGAIAALVTDEDVEVVNPFVQPGVLVEMALAVGRQGYPSRTHAMRELFGSLLPDELISRETKAGFTRPIWGPSVRAFAREWDGQGIDRELVDAEALRAQWLADKPDARAGLLLQNAWLASQRSSASS